MPRTITSRQFNQDTSGAKRAAEEGPVVITDRGRPTHVLMSFEEYERAASSGRFLVSLGEPPGVADLERLLAPSREPARPATFD